MRTREELEKRECDGLAPWAMHSGDSQGRMRPEPEHRFRTCFQRDRDRVLHSTAFRRLQYKTQVFVYHEGDHFRNRLTHTLEVAQIARSISRALGTNEDLTEAVVLAHDLGHTPFGHAGERAMRTLLEGHGGFEHNRQSLRIVDWLEIRDGSQPGLNLTHETRAGILKHGADHPPHPHPVLLPELSITPSLEAQVANVADSIAYHVHDIDDGLRSGLLDVPQLEVLELWTVTRTEVGVRNTQEVADKRGLLMARLIDRMVSDLVDASAERIQRSGVRCAADVQQWPERLIGFSSDGRAWVGQIAGFLRQFLYEHPQVVRMAAKGERILTDLWNAYTGDRRLVPGQVWRAAGEEPPERVIADYLACMTDRYAMDEHRKIFDPHVAV